ncbi:FAD-dependent oxidoreductase [Neosynechococcus sphagnicola]|uniref:FAD-dependent oxidoreductase n=1 Tax=Neosynechococcus sphagnicola TaxID=1501145 RepID=UPI00068A8381|nr:FAD-dependent oxidoreductase [Neosynechococcus sphagnicola]
MVVKAEHEILDIQQTNCCIVGGGPAGVMLALLLARQEIPVTLLEQHRDFDRDFRGDTIHPSTLEILDQLGLADQLLQHPHGKIQHLTVRTATQVTQLADFGLLKTKFPYIAVLPQVKLLEFMIAEAQRYPNFQLILGAHVQELVEENGTVIGIRYRGQGGWHEIQAPLTIGADGRFSQLRQLAGFEPVKSSPPMDVLWFRLPRLADDPADLDSGFRTGQGNLLVIIDRQDHWQLGYVIEKGSYQQLRSQGLPVLRQEVAALVPELGDRLANLTEWSEIAFLAVESSYLRQWYRPGLLLIGDAAHVMSPVAGVGINYAIQDAVVAANSLSAALKAGQVSIAALAGVQDQRALPVRVIQAVQATIQKQLVSNALTAKSEFHPPWILRFPPFQYLLVRLVGFGIWRVRLSAAVAAPNSKEA